MQIKRKTTSRSPVAHFSNKTSSAWVAPDKSHLLPTKVLKSALCALMDTTHSIISVFAGSGHSHDSLGSAGKECVLVTCLVISFHISFSNSPFTHRFDAKGTPQAIIGCWCREQATVIDLLAAIPLPRQVHEGVGS